LLGNDIAEYATPGQGVIFEGVLASPPHSIKANFHLSRENWKAYLRLWTPNDLPLKAMVDSAQRLGINTEVYTFVHESFADEVDKWLARKGLSVPVYYHESVSHLAYDLRFNRSIRTIYVATKEQASVIGIRATVVSPETAWSV
jgi:hypothetical protein